MNCKKGNVHHATSAEQRKISESLTRIEPVTCCYTEEVAGLPASAIDDVLLVLNAENN